jgi:hypothetical protein
LAFGFLLPQSRRVVADGSFQFEATQADGQLRMTPPDSNCSGSVLAQLTGISNPAAHLTVQPAQANVTFDSFNNHEHDYEK